MSKMIPIALLLTVLSTQGCVERPGYGPNDVIKTVITMEGASPRILPHGQMFYISDGVAKIYNERRELIEIIPLHRITSVTQEKINLLYNPTQ